MKKVKFSDIEALVWKILAIYMVFKVFFEAPQKNLSAPLPSKSAHFARKRPS